MIRLTLRNLRANKVRVALTTFGVMLAVSFVVSAFVLGDGLRSSFTTVSEDITAGVDLEVRSVADLGEAPPLPANAVDAVAGVEGVADAVADISAPSDAVRPIPPDGEPITTEGPPQLGFNWIDDERLSAFTLVEGEAPGAGEFSVDVDSAETHGFVIGDTYQVMVPGGTTQLRLSGTSSFGPDNATLGAVLMQMNTAEASTLFGIDGVSAVKVRLADGADGDEVKAAIADAVPGAEVVDRATVLEETTSDFTEEIDIVGNILLGFGGVALFVSIFLIYNTFAIVIGQRTRELALLRTVGAGPRQVRRSVMGEALAMGALAAVGGIASGVAIAEGLEALFGAMGAELVEHPTIVAARTVLAAVVVGVGVTVLAAAGPARRASTVPPVAALTGELETSARGSRTRVQVALGLLVAGSVAGVVGLSGAGPAAVTVITLSLGTISVFVGVALLSPLAVGHVTAVLGWPLSRLAGTTGRLARHNAARNPRRTATTAAALMIGLALVCTALVVGESVKSAISTTYADATRAEYYVSDQLEEVAFPAELPSELRQVDGVDAVTGFTYLEGRVDGSVTDVIGLELDQVEDVLDLGIQRGDLDPGAANPVVISSDEAAATGSRLGDEVTLELAGGVEVQATVAAVFDDQSVLTEDYLVDSSVLDAAGVAEAPEWLAVALDQTAPSARIEALVDDLSARFPYADVETAEEFTERMGAMVDDLLTMVNVMVALAVVIALIGIANTLALSVFERTRELGLIRAVGMTRRQLRRMVRMEASLVAGFGSVLGVGLGLLFGAGVVAALPASVAAGVAVPFGRIATVAAVAVLAGVVAAWLPARRAGRLDVLQAIAH
jgi:putative ABC transport system permease protein